MRRPHLTSFILLFGSSCFAAEAVIERSLSAPASTSTSATTPSSQTRRARLTSPDLAAKLGAGLPKFSAPNRPSAESSPVVTDPRPFERPQNDIVRLPNYDVRERKLPAMKERELLTSRGREALALKRHPGLKFGPFSSFNVKGPGLQMLEEEQKIERATEMNELAAFLHFVETELPRETAAAASRK